MATRLFMVLWVCFVFFSGKEKKKRTKDKGQKKYPDFSGKKQRRPLRGIYLTSETRHKCAAILCCKSQGYRTQISARFAPSGGWPCVRPGPPGALGAPETSSGGSRRASSPSTLSAPLPLCPVAINWGGSVYFGDRESAAEPTTAALFLDLPRLTFELCCSQSSFHLPDGRDL